MISFIGVGRKGAIRASYLVYRQKRNLRLRPPASSPEASAANEASVEVSQRDHATVVGSCGRDTMFVCWHPEKPFPYEHTKPIERSVDELRQGQGPLRADLQLQFKAGRKSEGPHLQELQDMFYTHDPAFGRNHRAARIAETCEEPPVDRKGL